MNWFATKFILYAIKAPKELEFFSGQPALQRTGVETLREDAQEHPITSIRLNRWTIRTIC
jgi:hypothetical protein